jgi:hypothetical protein
LDTLLIAGDTTRREKHNGSITTMDTRRCSGCHSGWLMIANAQQTQQANAVELTVLSAGAMRAALAELAPLFERSSGHKLIIEYGMVGKVEEKVVGDAPFDVAIVTRPPFDKLVGSGRIAGGSATPLARVPIGLAVKNGAARPDIGTVETLTKALHEARIVTYGDPGPGHGRRRGRSHGGCHRAARPRTRTQDQGAAPAPGKAARNTSPGCSNAARPRSRWRRSACCRRREASISSGCCRPSCRARTSPLSPARRRPAGIQAKQKQLVGFLAGESASAVYRAKEMQPD